MARFVSCPHKPDTSEINRLFHNLDHESDVASESEAESASDTESEESDEEALKKEMKKKATKAVKPTKAIQRRATMPRRQAASKKPKFEFSSESSEFENSEDDYQFSDWKPRKVQNLCSTSLLVINRNENNFGYLLPIMASGNSKVRVCITMRAHRSVNCFGSMFVIYLKTAIFANSARY